MRLDKSDAMSEQEVGAAQKFIFSVLRLDDALKSMNIRQGREVCNAVYEAVYWAWKDPVYTETRTIEPFDLLPSLELCTEPSRGKLVLHGAVLALNPSRDEEEGWVVYALQLTNDPIRIALTLNAMDIPYTTSGQVGLERLFLKFSDKDEEAASALLERTADAIWKAVGERTGSADTIPVKQREQRGG